MASSDKPEDKSNKDKNSPKLDKEMQKQLKERKEEMLLVDRFKKTATARLEAMARQSEETGIKYQMGEREKQIFTQMNGMGIKEGIAAGLVTFFVLRRGPIYISRWVYKRRLAQQQQQQQHQQHTHQSMNQSMPPPGDGSYQLSNPDLSKNPFEVAQRKDFPRSRNFFIRSIWFAFDSVLSLMMAASVSMSYTDTDKIRQQLIELPLVEGRSLTADALCDDIVKELQKIKKESNPAFRRLSKLDKTGDQNPASFYLDAVMAFSKNCQRRRFEEQKLRQEQGLAGGESVEIREPISPNGPRLVENDGEDVEVEESTENAFIDSEFREIDWKEATDFTDDQESADPGRRG